MAKQKNGAMLNAYVGKGEPVAILREAKVPAPRNKAEAVSQIALLVKKHKRSLDALSKL